MPGTTMPAASPGRPPIRPGAPGAERRRRGVASGGAPGGAISVSLPGGREWRRRGVASFSLVELLIALAIIAAVVGAVAAVYQPVVEEQRSEMLRSNLEAIRRAIFQFYNEHGRYPYLGQDPFGNDVSFFDTGKSELTQGLRVGAGKFPPRRQRYLLEIPLDPTADPQKTPAEHWDAVVAPVAGVDPRQVQNVRSKSRGFEHL